MTDENRLLLPKVDFIFKKIFGDEKNKEILKDFLASVLSLQKEKITGLTLTNNEIPKNHSDDKSGRLDVRVEMNDPDKEGQKIELNIEIQLAPHGAMSERVLFYWAKMYTNPIEEGKSYRYLRKTISIIIFDKNFLPLEKYHSKFHIWEDDERLKLTDVLEVHVLELEKAMKFVAEKRPPLDGLLSWSMFLSNNNLEVCEMLSAQSEALGKAISLQIDLSRRREIRDFYDRRLVDALDAEQREYDRQKAEREIHEAKQEIYEAKQEIYEAKQKLYEAEHRVLSQGKLETARKMLEVGLNFDIISKVTGLTEAQLGKGILN